MLHFLGMTAAWIGMFWFLGELDEKFIFMQRREEKNSDKT
jgi:hypothetical protein